MEHIVPPVPLWYFTSGTTGGPIKRKISQESERDFQADAAIIWNESEKIKIVH